MGAPINSVEVSPMASMGVGDPRIIPELSSQRTSTGNEEKLVNCFLYLVCFPAQNGKWPTPSGSAGARGHTQRTQPKGNKWQGVQVTHFSKEKLIPRVPRGHSPLGPQVEEYLCFSEIKHKAMFSLASPSVSERDISIGLSNQLKSPCDWMGRA